MTKKREKPLHLEMSFDELKKHAERSGEPGKLPSSLVHGGRWGGAVTAAMFLKEFVDQTPWIHLDIAGVAWMEENKSWIAKGPTGIAVRSLVEFVRSFDSKN